MFQQRLDLPDGREMVKTTTITIAENGDTTEEVVEEILESQEIDDDEEYSDEEEQVIVFEETVASDDKEEQIVEVDEQSVADDGQVAEEDMNGDRGSSDPVSVVNVVIVSLSPYIYSTCTSVKGPICSQLC